MDALIDQKVIENRKNTSGQALHCTKHEVFN